MTELGMSSRDALTAARPAASAYLGAGGLRVGAAADVVTYIRDPREDPGTLARPAAVVSRGVRLV